MLVCACQVQNVFLSANDIVVGSNAWVAFTVKLGRKKKLNQMGGGVSNPSPDNNNILCQTLGI